MNNEKCEGYKWRGQSERSTKRTIICLRRTHGERPVKSKALRVDDIPGGKSSKILKRGSEKKHTHRIRN